MTIGRHRAMVLLPMLVAPIALACSSEPPGSSDDTTWVGTITTEGDVTTVVNESGSVLGGVATLVEEASIGVEAGADEYIFRDIHRIVVRSGGARKGSPLFCG